MESPHGVTVHPGAPGARLGARRHIHLHGLAIDERHLDLRAENRLADPDPDPVDEIRPVTFEAFVPFDPDLDVQVTGLFVRDSAAGTAPNGKPGHSAKRQADGCADPVRYTTTNPPRW